MFEQLWFGLVEDAARQWWIHLARGIAALAFALVALAWPSLTVLVLIALVAFWAIVIGVSELIQAFWLRALARRLRG